MHAKGASIESDLRSATFEMLSALRKPANGYDVELPVIEAFDLSGPPEGVEMPVGDGRLAGAPRAFLRRIPADAKPELGKKPVIGCMLVREATFSIRFMALGGTGRTSGRPDEITRESAGRDSLASLATGLARNGGPLVVARHRATIAIDPIRGVQQRWSSADLDTRYRRSATEEER